ncbi:MAG: hypothetical protein QM657_15435 [Lacrimispora sp.]|uniref:hypothetical protein n=1 Tax=Lacrimispora sp. TaxID=2719234 RepID=UPI0039E57AEE
MNNINKDARLKYSTYGNGKAIIEILNIGFEPLLTEDEYKIYKTIGELKYQIESCNISISFIKSKIMYCNTEDSYYSWLKGHLEQQEQKVNALKETKKNKGDEFHKKLETNKTIIRNIYDDREFTNEDQFRNIAISESDLTRCFNCKDMEHSDDIVSVVTYYTDIFESIMYHGFNYKSKHFVFFTAGAGQTRCKKSTFVSEDMLDKNFKRLFCGLSKESINDQGGMNTNKYLAYTSLCQTNSEIWTDFNIDKAIVVEDIEYKIPNQEVRFIYTETPEDKTEVLKLQNLLKNNSDALKEIKTKKESYPKGYRRPRNEVAHEKELKDERIELIDRIDRIKSKYHKITIQDMDVTIPFTDGFGISLKKMQTSMIRLPFIKGLIAYCPKRAFQDWCGENGYAINKIIDIYGKSHSIANVDYIFTKSQFKMWKYYNNITDEAGNLVKTGWEVYKDNFKKYHCDACRCNVERGVKLNGKTNYQVLQTLTTEMSNKDIFDLAQYNITNLNGIGKDVNSMLSILGADETKNDNMNWLQKSLLIYPEMLKDFHVKTLLKNTKDSMIKKLRSGKFDINGAYTYVIPDPLACLQWWFTDMDKEKIEDFGFVKEGSVSCNLFRNEEEVDCLRSPHLDHAHCIRKNQVSDTIKKWTKSNGIYIGMKDTMSKLLMYDNDGDKLLIHNNKVIIKCAKMFQKKYGMIPNYYEMPKASPTVLDNASLFNGIVMAYHHGNIGTPSNEITKVWMTLNPNSTKEEVLEAIDAIALRCADVNFTIDYAKTLYKPEVPPNIKSNYKKYSGKKVPHFFIYAKNKSKSQVEDIGKCNVDRIYDIAKTNRIVFKDLLGKYSYKVLMNNPDINVSSELADKIIQLYRDVDTINIRKLSHMDFSVLGKDDKNRALLQIELDSGKQRKMFESIIGEPIAVIVDVLIKELQGEINKDTLWRLFGDVIYSNIEANVNGTKICVKCKDRFLVTNNRAKYCENCYREVNRTNALTRYYA